MKTRSDGWYTDGSTGESYYVPAGSSIHSEEERESIRQTIKRKQEYEEINRLTNEYKNDKCGEFFWSLYNVGFDYHPDLPDDLLSKVIYLLTYMDYNTNKLVIRDSAYDAYRPMKKDDVRKVIRLSKRRFFCFWDKLMNCGVISENECGELIVSDEFRRGKGKIDKRTMHGMSAIKIFSHAVRYVYENIDVRSHRYLSYLYRLIPFISLKYNVFCLNPLEMDKEKIQPLTVKELCELIGIEPQKHNEDRLINSLFKLMFIDKDKNKLSVITLIKRIVNDEIRQYITINPQFYAGYISIDEMDSIMNEFVIKEKEVKRLETS